MSLLGSLVEIFGLQDVLEPTPRMLEIHPGMRPLEVNGQKGWAVDWVQQEGRYQIETFGGDFVCIPEENLREYISPPADSGGFDTAWPAAGLEAVFDKFTSDMAQTLMEKSFCVVQMTNVNEQAKFSLNKALMREEWSRILPEFESSFLGTGSLAKINWLPEGAENASEEEDVLRQADKVLTAVSSMLAPFSQYFGFALGSRSAGMLRMPFEDQEEAAILMRGSNPSDPPISGREIEGCLQFTKLKRIGFIYFLHGTGGTLTLNYNDPALPPVELPIEQGRLLIIRHDLMNFSYLPKGTKNLALQAWIFREERPGEMEMMTRAGRSEVMEAWDKEKIPTAPSYGNSKESVDIMSVGVRLPGACYSGEDMWQLLHVGGDGLIKVPGHRWDHDIYYDPNAGPQDGLKMYCRHMGIFDSDVFQEWDNDFFEVSEEEARLLDPPSRVNISVAYETLVRAGWSKESMRDTEIAYVMGGSLSDWHDIFIQSLWEVKPTAEAWFNTTSAGAAHDRIPYTLGLRGPAFYIDTACSSGLYAVGVAHSMMRPQMPGQRQSNHHQQIPSALAQGTNATFQPFSSIGLCGAGMLTHNGRCFTFDASADGYVRGEGICGIHLQIHKSEELSRMAMLAGTAMGQDGKSASLTAPNGPSQTQVTRQSLREANITAFDIQTQELHGTGTPLGDPIEVGALRACMMSQDGEVRDLPLVKTSSKSAVGHGELNAGITGIMKCTLMLMFSAAIPGLHLRLLNPNMDSGGYPVLFNNELMDTGKVTDNCGVSSFGFSGCNARGDIWGMATAGPRKAVPIGMDFTAERHETFGATKFSYAGQKCLMPRSNDRPEGFDGVFGSGLITDSTQLGLSGTWTRWSTMDAMEKVPEMSSGDAVLYQAGFRMGETLTEEFCVYVDNYADNMIFPSCPSAGQDVVVLGPATAPQGHNWRVDGRKDGAQPGAVYVVSLWWYPETHEKRVTWEMMEEDLDLPFELHDYRHRYSVKGSWTSYMYQEMQQIEDGVFEITFKIGNRRYEEFHFSRDNDDAQLIYPTVATVSKTSLPIKGPDRHGKDKHWTVRGSEGDSVTLRLTSREGRIKLSIFDHNGIEKTWENLPAEGHGRYSLADYGGRCVPLEPCPDIPGVHRLVLTVTEREGQFFQIQLEDDPNHTIYPELNGAYLSGLSSALGPDAFGQDSFWQIDAEEGSKIEIILDTTQVDARQIVTWKEVSGRSLEDDRR